MFFKIVRRTAARLTGFTKAARVSGALLILASGISLSPLFNSGIASAAPSFQSVPIGAQITYPPNYSQLEGSYWAYTDADGAIFAIEGNPVGPSPGATNLNCGSCAYPQEAYLVNRLTGESDDIGNIALDPNGHTFFNDNIPTVPEGISADGNYVLFFGGAGIYLYDAQTQSAQTIVNNITDPALRTVGATSMSSDAKYIAYDLNNKNSTSALHLVDMSTGVDSVLSTNTDGFGEVDISGDGSAIVYTVDASTYLYNVSQNTTALVSGAGEETFMPTVSNGGTLVAYESVYESSQTHQVILHDLSTGQVVQEPIGTDDPFLSADGSTLVDSDGYRSPATSTAVFGLPGGIPTSINDNGTVITTTGGNFGDNTMVFVSNPVPPPPTLVQAIDAGGVGSGAFVADTDFSGGTSYASSAPVDTSSVNNPAPQEVWQTARYGNFTYTIPGLTPGANYTAQLDFNELYWGTSGTNGGVGSRVFNVSVNGSPALTNFDIFAAAGGANKAIAELVPTTADANGNITIQFTSVTDNAMVNGIEIYSGTVPPEPTPPTVSSAYIAAGGSGVGNFVADTDYAGGAPYSSTASVDTSGVVNPAPQAVYQNCRYGNFTYTIPNLTPNTSFNVRLDFNELYWGTAQSGFTGGIGSRVFNVSINGTQVLNNFDIYQAAGGPNIAVAENFTAQSDMYGNITIQFASVTDNALVNGIEIAPTQ